MFARTTALLALSLLCASAWAHEYQAGEIRIAHPHARATVPGQAAGAAYIGLENPGKTADKLLGASTPAAKSVELHTMSMENNMMRMREVGVIDVPPGASIMMKPGHGYHLMLLGLTKPLKVGDKFPLTLVFEKAGPVEVSISVDDMMKKDGEAKHQH